jgi:SET domain-containing protein
LAVAAIREKLTVVFSRTLRWDEHTEDDTKENNLAGYKQSTVLLTKHRPPNRHPKIVRRRSKLHGYGVFALEPINKNTRIVDYAGELIRNSRTAARERRYLAQQCIWMFRVNRIWSRDAFVGGNIARFINHSCTPNCWIEIAGHTIWIRASRLIRKGEELTYDYSTDGERVIACRCRPGCTAKL